MLRHVIVVVISGLCFFLAAKRCNPKIANRSHSIDGRRASELKSSSNVSANYAVVSSLFDSRANNEMTPC
jgi:hypothetical protein